MREKWEKIVSCAMKHLLTNFEVDNTAARPAHFISILRKPIGYRT